MTGRLSSNDPNLQNIPIRTAEGRRIREAFIAPEGAFDPVGRLLADRAADHGPHLGRRRPAARLRRRHRHPPRDRGRGVRGAASTKCSAEQRRFAKVINFGLIYGMSAFGLAANLGIERSAATAYIERYFARYPGVKRYMDETRASAAEKGYVETLFGRRVYLPEINKPGPRKAAAERQAINAPMQGTAADLIKLAMIAVQEAIDRERRATRMIMQVHDELVFEVPEAELAWAKRGGAAHHGRRRDAGGAARRRRRRRRQLGRGALSSGPARERRGGPEDKPGTRARPVPFRGGAPYGADIAAARPGGTPSIQPLAPGRERVGPLRRHRRARPRLVRRRARPHRRLHRPERRRQDDDVQLPVAPLRVQRGADRVRGPLAARDAAARHRRARHRPHVPEPRAVPDHERARERACSAATARTRTGFVANALRLPRVRREEAAARRRGRSPARAARPRRASPTCR